MPDLLVKNSIPKILLIDDEEGVRRTLKKIMEKEGYYVDTVENSENALRLLNTNSYDTVITDIKLPGMNGIELLKRIRQMDSDLPVVVITGYPNVDSAAEAVRQMAYDYVAKPVTRHNLLPILARSVEKKILSDDKKRLEKENKEYQRNLEIKVKERTREIEELNKVLRESQEKLILSERLATLGTFVSFISHDLRNPLSVTQNSIYYLTTHVEVPNEKVGKYFGIIEGQVGIANKIIDGFLNFTKGRPLDLQAENINELIKSVFEILIRVPGNIEIVLNLQEDLQAIEVEKEHIQQVLVNIINNAIHAMPEGGILTISTKQGERYLVIDISDTGLGISEDDMGRLFDPFFSKKKKGTGLGLVICRFLIERHNGKITISSKEGEGSTFSIHLPVEKNSGYRR